MSSCVAYSYGMFKLPLFSLFRRPQTGMAEVKSQDHRDDGGTPARVATTALSNSEWVGVSN